MEKRRENSSEVLLNMNGNAHVENNNMFEKQPFQSLDFELKPEKPVKQCAKQCTSRKIALLFAVITVAVILTVGTILIHKASNPDESGPNKNKNSSSWQPSTTISTTLSTLSSSSSSSTSSSSSSSTTSTSTTTTTTSPPCPFQGQFKCSDGKCINRTFVCDGKAHCSGAEDEYPNCSCSKDQFRCSSGQCIPTSNRCDGNAQCYDKSDEMNCSDCTGFECANGLCLWTMSVKCNGRVQCPDLSDEQNCPFRSRHLKCDNGVHLQDDLWCNGRDDCFDNSDEKDCALSLECLNTKRLACPDGKTCFVKSWKCDGFQDCPGGGDENNCGTCSGDQFQCPDYSCLDKSQVCDGQIDCPSGTDEVDCLQLNDNGELSVLDGIITARSHDLSLPVCSDYWSRQIADDVCEYLGNGPSITYEFLSLPAAGLIGVKDFVVLDPTIPHPLVNESVLAMFTKTSECVTKKVVSVTCSLKACGERQFDIMTPFIVGGVTSPPGKWPWMVSLSMLGQNICGGVIINQRWVLTAAHCIVTDTTNYTQTPHYFEVTAGTTSRSRTLNDKAQRISVDKILVHPKATRLFNKVLDWDLALLHLSEPVKLGDYVQPVCLPTSVDRFPTKSQCYLAGWGYINTNQVTVQDLREAKMTLWLDSECGAINYNSTICAGYHSGLISACQGDSGGPLMCKNTRDKWTVIGIMSYGADTCDGNTKRQASKFAEVLSSIDWLDSSLKNR